jgi:hypothetical protein
MSRAENESVMILNEGEIEFACIPGGIKKRSKRENSGCTL